MTDRALAHHHAAQRRVADHEARVDRELALELAEVLAEAAPVPGHAGLEALDRYTRRRRPIAAEEILAQADRNRSRMQERDPEKRRQMLGELQRTAEDPVRAREYLLRSSMIEGLRRAERQT